MSGDGEFVIGGIPFDVGTYGASINSYIQAGERVDINEQPLSSQTSVDVTVLPQNLQNELTGCDNNESCKYIAYDFDNQQVIPHSTSTNIEYTVNLRPFSSPNVGVLVKNTEDYIELTSLPTYDLSFSAYSDGTPIQTIRTPLPSNCAQVCDNLPNCEGFNFSAIHDTCQLFSPNSTLGFRDGDQVSFRKSNILSTPNQTINWGNIGEELNKFKNFNSDTAKNRCHDADTCDQIVSNIILNDTFSSFTTGSIDACKYCPKRKFHKIETGSGYAIITNENDVAVTAYSQLDSIYLLKYNYSSEIHTGRCIPGEIRIQEISPSQRAGPCAPCLNELPANSTYRYQCDYVTCASNEVPVVTGSSFGTYYMSDAIWCQPIPYGSGYQILGNRTILYKCPGVPPTGYKWDTPTAPNTCTYSSCDGKKFSYNTYITKQNNEIYTPAVTQWNGAILDYEDTTTLETSCSVTQCPLNYISNQNSTACVPCAPLGTRERRQSSSSCDVCTAPIGSTWASFDAMYTSSWGYPDSSVEIQCRTMACPDPPTTIDNGQIDQVWDINSTDLCAVRNCSIDTVANADKTACISRPGYGSVCDTPGSVCDCNVGSVKSGNQCVPCSAANPGTTYLTSNSCTNVGSCPNLSTPGKVWDIECSERQCFAGTKPSSDYTRCQYCGANSEPYTMGSMRMGYRTQTSGCLIETCTAPTGSNRWKYGTGCDFISCPRTPGANERWASTFGCDIVTYTGATVCSALPNAGNAWSDTTTCNITACPRTEIIPCSDGFSINDATTCWMPKPASGCPSGSTTSGVVCLKPRNTVPTNYLGPWDIWGPGCTKTPLEYWDDRPASSNTYPLKCDVWPRPGERFSEVAPCTIRQCEMSVAAGYIWNNSPGAAPCSRTVCPSGTFPNATSTKCIPCPTLPYYGWKLTGTLCRIVGCSVSTGITLAPNQYWTDPNCQYATCTAGNQVVNQICTPCPAIVAGSIWSSPGVSCTTSVCQGQTIPNATKTACDACPAMSPSYGFTFNNVNGCSPVACPAIASSNIWTTAGSCTNSKCTGHTQPNANQTTCVTCPNTPTLGNTWSSADGCAISACPAIASSNIYTTVGSCTNSKCTGHTQPNTDKSACNSCPITLGNTWSSTDGCAFQACPAIASSNIFTTIGSCTNSTCTGHTRPNGDKSACEACPITLGNTWTSTDGCAFQACPDISPGTQYSTPGSCTTVTCPTPPPNGIWDLADTRGQCNLICTVLPGQKIEDPRTCGILTWVSVYEAPAKSISVLTAPNYAYLPDFDRPTHRIRHSTGTSFGFDKSKISASWVTGYVRFGTYYFRITIGFDEQITTTNYNSDIEIYGYFVDKNGTQLVSPTINWVNGTSDVLSFGNITQFACDPPAPGFQWNPDGGCSTVPCTITPARGSFFDPSGGCRVYSCTTDLGITLGYNQFFTGVSCLTESCPVATILDTDTMTCDPVVCNPTGVSLPADSIYEVITSIIIPTCPPFQLVEGDQWSNDCGLTDLKPGSVYNFSTCIKNTQMYTGVCEEYNLPTWKQKPDGTFEADQFSKECQLYATKGSHILAGPSLPNGYHLGDYLQLRLKNPNGVIVQIDLPSDRNGMIDYVVPADGTYTVIQSCLWDGQCDGRIGYSGAVTASNFPSPNIETVSLLRDASGQEIMNSTYQNYPCPSGPTFYTGHSVDISIPLDSTGPFLLEQSCGLKACTGQTTITPVSTPSCAVRQCTGRTQPDVSKTLCQACTNTTLTPGTKWAATNGCQTTACTPAPTYGNTWSSSDTAGSCTIVACSPALASDSIWSGPSCASTQCTKGTYPAANKLSCTACPAIASSNIWTTAGSCTNSKCTGHTQPNAAKTVCDPCTSPAPGSTWSTTEGCATTTCPTAITVYGNVWDSTDTNGACRQTKCPSSDTDMIIPGKYIGTSSCTARLTCPATLTSGNGWDPTYDTFATCRQAPLVFNTRSTFSVTGSPAKYALLKDATSTYGTLVFTTTDAQGPTALPINSTGTSTPALQTGYTHIKFRASGSTVDRYFKITSNYTLGDRYIYGYLVDPVTNLQVQKFFSTTSQVLAGIAANNPNNTTYIYFGTMCPGPFTAGAGGQYFARSNTCTLSTCPTLVGYGETYTYPGVTCDKTSCPTIQLNKYYGSTGTCTTLTCPPVDQGRKYSSTRTGTNVCPSIISCGTLTGTNGWVTDLTGLGTCAQKVLTWTQFASVTTIVNLKVVQATTTTSDVIRTAYIYHPTTGTPVSSWATGFPIAGYTHIKFVIQTAPLVTVTFQVSTPVLGTDTAIYGFFVNDQNARLTGYPSSTNTTLSATAVIFYSRTFTVGNYS